MYPLKKNDGKCQAIAMIGFGEIGRPKPLEHESLRKGAIDEEGGPGGSGREPSAGLSLALSFKASTQCSLEAPWTASE
jgi:hypothetical protein